MKKMMGFTTLTQCLNPCIHAVMRSEPEILCLIECLTALCLLMFPYLSLSSLQTPPCIPLLLKVASLRLRLRPLLSRRRKHFSCRQTGRHAACSSRSDRAFSSVVLTVNCQKETFAGSFMQVVLKCC